MSYYGYYGYYRRSKPREVKGGIKAHSKRGEFGQSWWGKRWIRVLEDFDLGGRLDRGKSYARRGQVKSLEILNGLVLAEVQGSEHKPYNVKIKIKKLGKSKWQQLAQEIFSRPSLAAKLLIGQMPDDIESILENTGIQLFPNQQADLHTNCDCLDWSNPCKHIAAVYLLLSEEFDRDPFLIFKLRGADRNDILDMAGLRPIIDTMPSQHDSSLEPKPELSSEPLPSEPDEFWGQIDPNKDSEQVQIPATSAALPKRLGGFPFWRGDKDFIQFMEEIYHNASSAGLDIFVGDRQSDTK